jgi:hypothetical protein
MHLQFFYPVLGAGAPNPSTLSRRRSVELDHPSWTHLCTRRDGQLVALLWYHKIHLSVFSLPVPQNCVACYMWLVNETRICRNNFHWVWMANWLCFFKRGRLLDVIPRPRRPWVDLMYLKNTFSPRHWGCLNAIMHTYILYVHITVWN